MNNNTIIMPVRKRSPTSGNSVYTTIQPTFTTLPENPQTSFQTMRQVNPDGSSTVYHVHDSINGGMVGGLPPQVVLGGSSGGIPLQQTHHIMSQQQQQAPISGGMVYPSYGQQQQQPNIVYVQSDEYSDSDVESDNEESTALVQHNQSQSPKNKRRIKCCLNSKSTSTICILTSILFAISFIIGYIFLIDAIVTNNRNNHSSYNNNGNQNVMPGSSLRIGSRAYRGGIPSHVQHQQDEEGGKVYNTPLNTELEEKLGLTEKYYVVKPMISEISVGKIPTSSEGGVVGNLGGAGVGVQQQQYQRPIQVDKQHNNQLVQEPRNGKVSGSGGGSHMKDVEEQKQQETRTVPGIVPRSSEQDGPVRRRR